MASGLEFAEVRDDFQQQADLARDTIERYWQQNGVTESPTFSNFLSCLSRSAREAQESADLDMWKRQLMGAVTGSETLGALRAARLVILGILRYGTTLPEGSTEDTPGTLSKHGLTKLEQSLKTTLEKTQGLVGKSRHLSASGTYIIKFNSLVMPLVIHFRSLEGNGPVQPSDIWALSYNRDLS